MAELRLKDIRLPVLRLPEMSRDDIGKALRDARRDLADLRRDALGDVRRDLADLRRDIDLTRKDLSRIDLSQVELPTVDVSRADVSKAVDSAAKSASKAVDNAAKAVGVRRSPSRVPFVIAGMVTLGLISWTVFSSPLTPRLRAAAARARERLDERRLLNDAEVDEPHAFDEAVAVPVEPSAYADALPSSNSPFAEGPSDLPNGLGSESTSDTNEVARA